jgi:hypothetical protein
MATIEKRVPGPAHDVAAESSRLVIRVRELEHLLELERARSRGLERGLSAMSERVVELRAVGQSES